MILFCCTLAIKNQGSTVKKTAYFCRTTNESVVPREDATVKELTLILREWFVKWKDLYMVQ